MVRVELQRTKKHSVVLDIWQRTSELLAGRSVWSMLKIRCTDASAVLLLPSVAQSGAFRSQFRVMMQ